MKHGEIIGKATYHGITLPEVRVPGGARYPDLVEVNGIAYYVHDFGGVQAGSRQVFGKDYGGNVCHGPRTAPEGTMGVAADLPGRPVRAAYSDAEFWIEQ